MSFLVQLAVKFYSSIVGQFLIQSICLAVQVHGVVASYRSLYISMRVWEVHAIDMFATVRYLGISGSSISTPSLLHFVYPMYYTLCVRDREGMSLSVESCPSVVSDFHVLWKIFRVQASELKNKAYALVEWKHKSPPDTGCVLT